jgi:hypothetical protein
MEGFLDNLNEPVIEGKWYEMPQRFDTACCDCFLVHNWRLKIKNGKICAKLSVDRRSTAQRRRHGQGGLFGEDHKWEIVKR